MPQEFSGLPLCDIDPYYEDKKTFMVITGSKKSQGGFMSYIYCFFIISLSSAIIKIITPEVFARMVVIMTAVKMLDVST